MSEREMGKGDLPEGASILVVDDDALFRERLARALRDRGYEVLRRQCIRSRSPPRRSSPFAAAQAAEVSARGLSSQARCNRRAWIHCDAMKTLS